MFKQSKKVKSKAPAAGKKSAAAKRVYFFGNGKAEGNAGMKDLLGGKGANLADMTLVPLPVPTETSTRTRWTRTRTTTSRTSGPTATSTSTRRSG